MAFLKQLGLLLWKNLLLQRRKICVTVFEIILPLLFAAVFLGIRFAITVQQIPGVTKTYTNSDLRISNAYELRYKTETLYTPNNTVIEELINHVRENTAREESLRFDKLNFTGFATTQDMLEYFKKNSKRVNLAIDFLDVKHDSTSLPKKLRYELRPPVEYYRGWETTKTAPFVQSGFRTVSFQPPYENTGFLYLQRKVDEAVINHWDPDSNFTMNNLSISIQQMPEPSYFTDPIIIMLQLTLPIFLMLSFILLAIQTTKGIVYEKEKKLKESMKLMGLSAAAHWASWFIYSFIYVLVIMAVYAIFCGVDASGNGAPLANSDPSLFFVFLLCYGVALISYCFMISVFVQRANVGAAISGICFFISFCPYFYLQIEYQQLSRSAKLASCLVMNIGMSFGAYVFALYEGTGDGAQWSNISQPASLDDNFSLLDAILMLLLDTFLHLLVTWYVDNVRPGEFGVPKPWYFPFTSTYWCGNKQKHSSSAVDTNDERHFEKEPTGMKVGISIRNLKKVFGKNKVAVDGMSLNMYQDQISVLLGHNGAGKTTTMSMLTGFIPATGGTAMVNGYDINTDIQSVRESLGLCPQHNILFDTLTVKEHLEFFASLKGCAGKKVAQEVTNIIREVGLAMKTHTQSQHLSGGQKRKLSVGIALIAGSKIVILDEPTSGMDPAARRQTWDILQRNRKGRTMLLTTHFMDEADLLGDRIAIMAEGVVKCCGTSYFLKKLYGAGYHLVMVKTPSCKVSSVTAVVKTHIPSAMLESEINAEISYLLPNDQSARFAGLFTELEQREKELGITSFGTSATTMEEVFLKVENEEETMNNGNDNGAFIMDSLSVNDNGRQEANTQNILEFNQGYRKSTGLLLQLSRFRGIFIKKVLHSWRNKTLAIIQLLLPVLFTLAALAISKVEISRDNEVPLILDLSAFRGTTVSVKNDSSSFVSSYKTQFSGSPDSPLDIVEQNISKYFLSKGESMGQGVYNKKMIIGAHFQSDQSITAFYNGQPFHSQPISLSFIMNSLLQHFTSSDYSLSTINNPLPFNATDESTNSESFGQFLGFSIAFCMLFGMAFLTSSFIYFLVKERQVGAKHLQTVSGVGPFVFWMANFLWDFINFLIPSLLLLVVFAAFQSPAYVDDGRLGLVFLLLLVYGMAVLPYMYLFQFLFKSPATGVVVTIILNIITGLATLLTTYILTLVGKKPEAEACDWVFSVLFPHFNFGKSILNMYSNYINLGNCIKQDYITTCVTQPSGFCCRDTCIDNSDFGGFVGCIDFVEDYLAWEVPGILRHVIFMLLQCVVCLAVTLAIEYHLPQRIMYLMNCNGQNSYVTRGPENEHPDVANERLRVDGLNIGHDSSDALVLKKLYKRYGNFVAVDHLSVGIPEKECFGLLGQNGAGKTTTFKMLTGDVMVTGGNAHLWEYDVKNNIQKMQENMGYCPQFDALIDQMTGRETLAMYARLKGIPESAIKDVCKHLLDIMMLRQHADKPTSDYSGGNKRKLSTAIALVGDPAFIMLDEPSTGMDPKARRQLWNVLSKVRECNRTLLLTSHSMEECDALCTRLAIMVNGRFRCLGTPQHLKSTFGQGYTLIARMATVAASSESPDETAPASSQPLIQFIMTTFPYSRVFDDHQGYVHFQVPDSRVKLAQIFTTMEQAKVQFFVEDYSVHQTTLEQIFLSFVRDQIPPKEEAPGCCKTLCCCC